MVEYFPGRKYVATSTNLVLECSFKTNPKGNIMRTYGIERERFIQNAQGQIVPAIGALLPLVQQLARDGGLSENRFTFELFAGQIEDRTQPSGNLAEVRRALVQNDMLLSEAARQCGFTFDYSEFMELERIISLEVNPFDERHQKIWGVIPVDRKVAASVVAAVHVHISVAESEVAQCLNSCRLDVIERLITLGDHSGGARTNSYRVMAETNGVPPIFSNFSEVMAYITSKGGERNVWDLVRYKPTTGTVEFRMFGATESVDEVFGYIEACHRIVQDAEHTMDPQKMVAQGVL